MEHMIFLINLPAQYGHMKKLQRLFILISFILSCSADLSAQFPDGDSFWDRLYFGGNFGLQFGDQTLVDLSPLVGYRLTEKLSVGVGATYIYYHFEDPYHYYPSYSTHIYGGSIFTRYYFLENIFGQVEG